MGLAASETGQREWDVKSQWAEGRSKGPGTRQYHTSSTMQFLGLQLHRRSEFLIY